MWKQRACSSGWRRRRRQEAGWEGESGGGGRRGSFAAPNLVFFRSGELVVYCLAVAAWFSTGLICHPIKKRTALVDTEWESASLLCSSKKDGEDKTEKTERLADTAGEGASVDNRFLQQKRGERRCRAETDAEHVEEEKSEWIPTRQTEREKSKDGESVYVCVCVCLVEGVALRLSSSVVVFKSRLVC